MRKSILFLLLIFLSIEAHAQAQINKADTSAGYYQNPVFPGDYPDPSILRDGDNYYVVHSSFEYYPGLLIWHSKDLINWVPVTNALHTYIGSVWAPDLVKYSDKYYIYFPANNTNYVVTANSIGGPWSEPIDLEVGNIDPGHIADSDGNRYLYFSSGGYVPLSKDGLSVTGELQHTYDGWEIPREWTIECFCMEGPKLFKRGDYYYLTTAEGGTAGPPTGHMVISARSKSIDGPWENSPYNPIIRTEDPTQRWGSVGHGTPFQDTKGNWWLIFHGYEKEHYNMGRQTLLMPLEWTKEDWYKIPDSAHVNNTLPKPVGKTLVEDFSLTDNFNSSNLSPHWKFFADYDSSRFRMSDGQLIIDGKGSSVANSSPLLTMPSDHSYRAQVELKIKGNAIGGLVLFYNQNAYSGILADGSDILANLRGWQYPTEAGVIDSHVFLRLENRNNTVDMFYSTDGEQWIKIKNSLEVSGYHHNVLSGFLSLRIGLASIGEGKVVFDNFKYSSLD